MSAKHPIIAVTGSSGAGTPSVTRTFNWIFNREKIDAVVVEGDSFHRFDRLQMKAKMAEAVAAKYGTTCTTTRKPHRTSRSPAPSPRGRTSKRTPI